MEDDGEWGRGAIAAGGEAGASGEAAGAGGAGGSGSGAAAPAAPSGLRIYLSAIKEWILEIGFQSLFISIRTDSAWYRLLLPSPDYQPWWTPLLRACRVAVRALTLIDETERKAKLPLEALVRKLAEEAPESLCFVSPKPAEVDAYLVVHGQILLNQLRVFPKAEVKKSVIPAQLRERMLLRKHIAIAKKSGGGRGGASIRRTGLNLNPVRSQAARAKPMRATTTLLVQRVWAETVGRAEVEAAEDEAAEVAAAAAAKDAVAEVAEVEEDEEEAEEEAAAPADPKAEAKAEAKAKVARAKRLAAARDARATLAKVAPPTKLQPGQLGAVAWGDAGKAAEDGARTHELLRIGAAEIRHGHAVWVPTAAVGGRARGGRGRGRAEEEDDEEEDDEEEEEEEGAEAAPRRPAVVMRLWEDCDGEKLATVRELAFGVETVLRSAASPVELFLTPAVRHVPVAALTLGDGAVISRLTRPWGFAHRAAAEAEDVALLAEAADRAAKGLPPRYVWRRLWVATQGAFLDPPADCLDAEAHEAASAAAASAAQLRSDPAAPNSFHKDGVTYQPGDYLYLLPDGETLKQVPGCPVEKPRATEQPSYLKKGCFQKGVMQELPAFVIAKLLSVKCAAGGGRGGRAGPPESLRLHRMVRPEDLGPSFAYKAEKWELLDSEMELSACPSKVVGPCTVLPPSHAAAQQPGGFTPDTFVVVNTWDVQARVIAPPPADMALPPSYAAAQAAAAASKAAAAAPVAPLRALDIFAGCGGLSEGMRQVGAAVSKWAIEYEPDAAKAFEQNHAEAVVYNANCNVILRRCMSKAGMADGEVQASPEAEEQAKAMDEAVVRSLPVPGEVEFICGGPPCQGFSGMNRFTLKGSLWSKVQNEMILSYLSYADVYRPRYFLLENVRNFVAFNHGLTFRTAVRTLLELGYQVRFGVLNAAFYGVGQSRKRAFLLAAAPGEAMPDWPLPQTCFDSPQLTFELPCGTKFCAVPQRKCAPLRAVTVRDVICDLPPAENGEAREKRAYGGPPVSAFQKQMRVGKPAASDLVENHICKTLNPVNLRRCQLVPRESMHDWRYLRLLRDTGKIESHLTEGSKVTPIVPDCLDNATQFKHNGWRGLYSRLNLEGHFPTSTTDPNPMGKVGQVFHPSQDRIVSVRECARSQGFPDTFTFYGARLRASESPNNAAHAHFHAGNVTSMHRQVGNAVPPPLAAALGRELKKALEKSAAKKA